MQTAEQSDSWNMAGTWTGRSLEEAMIIPGRVNDGGELNFYEIATLPEL
ncbi:hypothetical protein [Methanovulcanius yangii]|nr:hypothetical protein [Methanovulcanius yangii]